MKKESHIISKVASAFNREKMIRPLATLHGVFTVADLCFWLYICWSVRGFLNEWLRHQMIALSADGSSFSSDGIGIKLFTAAKRSRNGYSY